MRKTKAQLEAELLLLAHANEVLTQELSKHTMVNTIEKDSITELSKQCEQLKKLNTNYYNTIIDKTETLQQHETAIDKYKHLITSLEAKYDMQKNLYNEQQTANFRLESELTHTRRMLQDNETLLKQRNEQLHTFTTSPLLTALKFIFKGQL